MSAHHTLPRLLTQGPLSPGQTVSLTDDQAHYLRGVLRREQGDEIRAFDGASGEYLCQIEHLGKKGGVLKAITLLRPMPVQGQSVILCFAPIRKSRMEWLIEKAVELGADTLQPVMTDRAQMREINADRLQRLIAEAAEQCERLTVPELKDPVSLRSLVDAPGEPPLIACLERIDAVPLPDCLARHKAAPALRLLIGPEGGFSDDELAMLTARPTVEAANLGTTILRAETAAIAALALARINGDAVRNSQA